MPSRREAHDRYRKHYATTVDDADRKQREQAERYSDAIGPPNQLCPDCRAHGLCAYHRDFPHNLGSRKE